jgi:hypothetical protein
MIILLLLDAAVSSELTIVLRQAASAATEPRVQLPNDAHFDAEETGADRLLYAT